MTQAELIVLIKSIIATETGIDVQTISDTDTFLNLGLDSVSSIFLIDKLEKKIKLDLNPIHFWDYPSIDTYAGFLHNTLTHGS